MTYTFAEKKRLRKSFAKRASVLPVPYLLATQLDSYAGFLQEFAAPEARRTERRRPRPWRTRRDRAAMHRTRVPARCAAAADHRARRDPDEPPIGRPARPGVG